MNDTAPSRPFLGLPYLTALCLAAGITISVWPGFMSYDSLLQLREARQGVGGGCYPTLPSYMWMPFDAIWPGPALMLTFQNGLFLLAVAHLLVRATRWHAVPISLLTAAFALLPPLFGPMLVVWKDVGMMAFLAAGAAMLLHAETARTAFARNLALVPACLFLTCGAAYRLNAIPAVLPFVFWMAGLLRPSARPAARSALALLALALIAAVVFSLSTWRLPSFERLPRATNHLNGFVFDLYGISHFSRHMVVPPEFIAAYPDYSLRDVDEIYRPFHMNYLVFHMPDTMDARLPARRFDDPARIASLWRKAICSHPGAYLRHRLSVCSELISLHRRPVFYPTHPQVDPNDLGVAHRPTRLTRLAVGYEMAAAQTPFARPWIYYVPASICAAFLLSRRPPGARLPLVLAASAACYMAPYALIGIAADLRYNCWAVAACTLCIALTLSLSCAKRVTESSGREA
jgi:hypothetical protein